MNNMDNLEVREFTYEDFLNHSCDELKKDNKILTEYLIEPVYDALSTNPIINNSEPALIVALSNNVPVGRYMLMATRIMTPKGIIAAQTGGSFEVDQNCRGKGIGTALIKESINRCDLYIGQLYSTQAFYLMKKMKPTVFEVPLFIKVCKSRSVFESRGVKGISLSVVAGMVDVVLKACDIRATLKIRKLKKKYRVTQEVLIPKWVEELTLSDGHPFSEVHDCQWLQWNLNHKFTNNIYDNNAFYAVYDKNRKPIGFFMTKERFEENEQNEMRGIVRGTIVEWGSFDETALNELDINALALSTFSPNVEKINTAVSTGEIVTQMHQLGFVRHGDFQFALKLNDYSDCDIIEQKKWRLRYGGANTILV